MLEGKKELKGGLKEHRIYSARETQHNLVIDLITMYTIVNFPKAFYALIHSSPGALSCANQSSTLQLFKKILSRLGRQHCFLVS